MEISDEAYILIFDLRNGRVGGLTFCEIVEGWFSPDQSFMIDNDLSVAVAQWQSLPQAIRRDMRFIWGHSFTLFEKRVELEQPIRIASLVRHPLLKASGFNIRTPDQLAALDGYSIEHEFELYGRSSTFLPCGAVDDFLEGHFFLGVTELMEESLFLLHRKMNIKAPLKPWRRSGSLASLDDNIYAHGLVKNYVMRPQYQREITHYHYARKRLFGELRRLAARSLTDITLYKAECAARDVTVAKWNDAYPGIFQPAPAPPWRVHLRPLRPWRPPPPSAIHLDAGRWTIVLSTGEAEAEVGDGNELLPSLYDVVEPLLTFHLHHVHVAGAPNLLRVELDLPNIDCVGRWVYALMENHKIFQVEVGSGACAHAMEIPLSPSFDKITILINQYQETKGRRLYAKVRRLQALCVPFDGRA